VNAQTVLNYLEMVANNNLLVNSSMHIVALIALAAVFIVKKDIVKRLIFQSAVSTLFLSVTINALLFGNPFHAATFGILAITSLVELFKGKNAIRISTNIWNVVIGFLFVFIGLWYPEFVNKNLLLLLFVSPAGIIPCPTLLVALGLLTLIFPKVNRVQYAVTTAMGIIYAVIGVFVFKVYLDITLLALVLYAICIYYKSKKRNTRFSSNQILSK